MLSSYKKKVRSFGRFGSAASVLNFIHLGSSVSVRMCSRLGSNLSVLDFTNYGLFFIVKW